MGDSQREQPGAHGPEDDRHDIVGAPVPFDRLEPTPPPALIPTYLEPPKHNVLISAAEFSADSVAWIRSICRAAIIRLRNDTDTIINNKGRGPIEGLTRPSVRWAVMRCLNTGRKLRVFDKVPIYKLPNIVDNEDEDRRLKGDIVEDLDSRIGVSSPFVDELEHIARNCFDRGIDPERLIKLLESEEILNMLIDEVLNLHHSRYRSGSFVARVSSILESIERKLKDTAEKLKLSPVDPETEKQIIADIDFFKKNYNPKDIAYTVANFVTALRAKYGDYNILDWLKTHKKLLIDILKGNTEGLANHTDRHISNIIYEAYERRGRQNPAQFIHLNVPEVLQYHSHIDMPLIARLFAEQSIPAESACFIFDVEWLQYLFEEKFPRIQGQQFGLAHLQKMLIDICCEEIGKIDPNVRVLVLSHSITESGHLRYIVEAFESNEKLKAAVADAVRQHTKIISSHVDVVNLLADPEAVSPEIRQNYQDWFDGDGELNKEAYQRHLRSVFGHLTRGETAENINALKKRVGTLLSEADNYLTSVSDDLSIPHFTISDLVKNTNDYAELVKIANTSGSKEERFAARRKIELAILIYSCLYTPRMVYRDHDATEIQKVLESSTGSLVINQQQPLREIHYVDPKDGKVRVCAEGFSAEDVESGQLKSFKLIPAQFANIDCYLLPTTSPTDERPETERDYMGKKRLNSTVTKLIHRDQMRAKDVTDILRMTFVVDSVDNLLRLQEHLETNYISFGRTLKRENRYGEFVRVSSFNVAGSASKSDEYRSLRYVVDIPIWDQVQKYTYFAPLEIRVLLIEDCAREKSAFNDASHERYERRRLRRIMRTIAPQQIHPDLYKTLGPDEHDVFGRREMVLKTAEDFAEAA